MQNKVNIFYQTLINHKISVSKNVLEVIKHSDLMAAFNIDTNALLPSVIHHDNTKLWEPLLSAYIEITWYYYQKRLGKDYSLNKDAAAKATLLHITSESHHPEFWDKTFLLDERKFNPEDRDGLPEVPVDAREMPFESIVEMVCDWYAVSKERGSSLYAWAEYTIGKRWVFDEDQIQLIYSLIEIFEKD